MFQTKVLFCYICCTRKKIYFYKPLPNVVKGDFCKAVVPSPVHCWKINLQLGYFIQKVIRFVLKQQEAFRGKIICILCYIFK